MEHQNDENESDDIEGLFELSIDAYYAALYARMSELPIRKEISRFIGKVKKAAASAADASSAAGRAAAERAASDRGDPDVLTVQKAAYKVGHEIHRMTGFLRFRAEANGVYTAHCAPDYCILPALAEHFTLRFGETPWAIIDEKRALCLRRAGGGPSMLVPSAETAGGGTAAGGDATKANEDLWEGLWRLYHRSINIEERKNLRLQRQLMPERYRKYLTEV